MKEKYADILSELREAGIVGEHPQAIKEHLGGTSTILLEIRDADKAVAVKLEQPEMVEEVVRFLNEYSDISLFSHLLYVSKEKDFFVYAFVEGEKCQRLLSKEEVEYMIDNVINRYRQADSFNWGDKHFPSDSLLKFVNGDISRNKEKIDEVLGEEEYKKMSELSQSIFGNFTGKPYLVHGDLGTHNIILSDDKIAGVIDPIIDNGLPLLELLFLICSKPHQFDMETILEFCDRLKDNSGFTNEDVPKIYKIMLYNRIGTCIKYHKLDLESFIDLYKKA